MSLKLYNISVETELELVYVDTGIKAGFPRIAPDITSIIDLNKELVKHPANTFCGRVSGDSMQDANLEDGDIIVIDRSLNPRNGDMAVCVIDKEFTAKFIKIEKDGIWLIPANENYDAVKVTENDNIEVWGIITHCIKKVKRG